MARSWRVRDVVAHLVDTALRRLSFHRDRQPPPAPSQPIADAEGLLAFVNELNRQWTVAAQRLSPRVLTDLYAAASRQLAEFFETLPFESPALFPVSWAGEAASAGWFDVGREFTEVWHHQVQVREAVGAPPSEPVWRDAVLALSIRALPHAYRNLDAPAGTSVGIQLAGSVRERWTLIRQETGWTIHSGSLEAPTVAIQIDADIVWRVWFNALGQDAAPSAGRIDGERSLAAPFFQARSVIV